jgi:hypothetical protein
MRRTKPMDTLPLDILRLLPQWLTWPEITSLILVNKRWLHLFKLPQEITVYTELNDGPIPHRAIALIGLNLQIDERGCKRSHIQVPTEEVNLWLRGEGYWRIGDEHTADGYVDPQIIVGYWNFNLR